VVFSIGKDFAIVGAGGKTTQIHRMIGVEYEVRLTGRIPPKLKSAFVRVITHAAGGDYVSLPADLPSAYADITDTGGLNRDRLYQGSRVWSLPAPQALSRALTANPSRLAVCMRISFTCSQVTSGRTLSMSAVAPVTCGVAMLVPRMIVYHQFEG
jgi:hypothetical protein